MSPAAGRRVPALLVAHGDLARELKETAESIAGDAGDLVCLSNRDCSPEELVGELERRLDALGPDGIVLVDLAGGSCLSAVQRACRRRPGLPVVTGVNLPLLLDYLQNRETLPRDELLAHIVERGHRGLRVLTGGC